MDIRKVIVNRVITEVFGRVQDAVTHHGAVTKGDISAGVVAGIDAVAKLWDPGDGDLVLVLANAVDPAGSPAQSEREHDHAGPIPYRDTPVAVSGSTTVEVGIEKVVEADDDMDSDAGPDVFERARQVVEERERTHGYGPVAFGHANLGKAWAALLSTFTGRTVPPLPGELVALMLVVLKALRASKPGVSHIEERYIALVNYASFAAEMATARESGQSRDDQGNSSTEEDNH